MRLNEAEIIDQVVDRLRKLADERPDLKNAARIYEAILPLLDDADLRVAPVALTPEEAGAKLKAGLPLLPGLDLELDVQTALALILGLARSIETISGTKLSSRLDAAGYSNDACKYGGRKLPEAARRIRLVFEEDKADVGALLSHVTEGDRAYVDSVARDLRLDSSLLWVLAQNTLKPALHAWRRQLAPLAEGVHWDRGYCFICGAEATLGELRESEQVMHLRCGQCGADWQSLRLRCVFCGNEDHGTLKCLYSEDQLEKMRVEACDRCRGYLKVITSFFPTPPEMLPVEDLATLHLDYIAQERGYGRVSRSID